MDSYFRDIGSYHIKKQEATDIGLGSWGSPRAPSLAWIGTAKIISYVVDEDKRPTGKFRVFDEYSGEEYEAIYCANAYVNNETIECSFRMLHVGEYVIVARGKETEGQNFILCSFTGYMGPKGEWMKHFQLGEGNDVLPGEIVNVGPLGSRVIQTAAGVIQIAPGDIVSSAFKRETLKKNPLQEILFDPVHGLNIAAEKMSFITSAGAEFWGLRTGAHKTPGNPLVNPSRVTRIIQDSQSNMYSGFVETTEGNLSTTGIPGGGYTPIYQRNMNNKVMVRGWRSGKYEVVCDPTGPPAVPLSAEIISANAVVSTLKHEMDPVTQTHSIVGPIVNINSGTPAQNPCVSLNIEAAELNVNSKHPNMGVVSISTSALTIDAAVITLKSGPSTITITPAGIVIKGPVVTVN